MTIAFACPGCASQFEVPDDNAGALADCPECGREITVPQPAGPVPAAAPAAAPVPAPVAAPAAAPRAAGPLYSASPAMFRNRPVMFILLCILCIPFIIGIPVMLIWWLKCRGTRLTVDARKTSLRTGILSRHEIEVRHCDIRKVSVSQNVFQRIFNVGTLRIGSAATGGVEIEVAGIPAPVKLRDTINTHR